MDQSINPNRVSSDISIVNPSDYLSALKTQSNLPVLIIKKLSSIVEEYYNIRPQMIKKQNQMKTLYMYNQKLLATIENFIAHQKKITEKYNTLASMYIKSFKKYCDSKNWQVNFTNLKPIHSLFQNFSMSQWKFEIPNNEGVTVKMSYQEMLMKIIKKYFINGQDYLQKVLDTVISESSFSQNKQTKKKIQQIKLDIKQLHSAEMNTDNMFELLQKRKDIQFSIKNLNDKHYSIFLDKDLNFIEQITKLHSRLLTTNLEDLKDYLQRQREIWQGLKKKNKQYRNILDDHFEKMQTQNNELKEELESSKKKLTEVQTERNQFRTKFQYLQLKQSSKKERGMNNTSSFFQESRIIEDTKGPTILKQLNKKLEIRIGQMERQIKQLKKDVDQKDQALQQFSLKKDVTNRNAQMEEMRLKLQSKLSEFGIDNTVSMNFGEMLDKLFQKVSANKRYEKDNCSDLININMTESIPNQQISKCSAIVIRMASKDNSNLLQQDSHIRSTQKREDEQLQSKEGKQIPNSSIFDSKSYIQSKIAKDKDTTAEYQLKQKNQQQKESSLMQNKMIKKSEVVSRPLSYQLNCIQQHKSLEQESKMIDGSKMKERSINNEEKISFFREDVDEIKNARQKDQNTLLNRQIMKLREEIKILQKKNLEKEKSQKQVFSNRGINGDYAFQIESICHTLAKQLSKLEGNQFQKTLTSIDEAIKRIKSGMPTSFPQKPQADHFNQIPVLSKMMHDQSDLLKSENIVNMIYGKPKDDEVKLNVRRCSSNIQKSDRLTLKSGEIQLQIKLEKSYYFGSKQSSQNKHLNFSIATKSMVPVIEQEEISPKRSTCEIKQQEELINIVNNFESTSRKQQKSKYRDEEHSLGLSQSNLKNSFTIKQSELKQLRQMRDQARLINIKLAQDEQLLLKLEQKLEQIKNDKQQAKDLHWFYQRYKQTFAALERSESIIRSHEKRKSACTTKLSANDASLSRPKLEETIYFLQQRVNELQDLVQVHKNQYQVHITEQLKDIAELKQTAIDSLVRGVLTKNYLQFSGGKPFQR